MSDDPKPEWKHKISRTDFRRMYLSWITKITHHSVALKERGADNFIRFHDRQGNFNAPPHWYEYFYFSHNGERLIIPNLEGIHAAREEMKITEWEKRNASNQ